MSKQDLSLINNYKAVYNYDESKLPKKLGNIKTIHDITEEEWRYIRTDLCMSIEVSARFLGISRDQSLKLNRMYRPEFDDKESRRRANLVTNGVEFTSQKPESRRHMRENYKAKTGFDWPINNPDVRKKIQNTLLDKTGYDHNWKDPNCYEKHKKTMVEKFGVENALQNEELKQKAWDSTIKTCGYKTALMDPNRRQEYVEKIRETKKKNGTTMGSLEVQHKKYLTQRKNGTLSESKAEKELREFIETELGYKTEKYIRGAHNTKFELDIYIPQLKLGIEYNGSYWHSTERKTRAYHYNKSREALKEDIQVIYIWEDQWKYKQEILKDILRARLGILKNRIYARQCIIKEIDNKSYKDFCEETHIQGYKAATVKFGLFYNDQLVQIASFSKTRQLGQYSMKDKPEWEWIRGCIASNNAVIGGDSKLLKYFIRKYNPKSILCYADWNLFSGVGYEKAGFEFKGYTGPDKFYIRTNTLERVNRNPGKYKEYMNLVKNKIWYLCYGAGSKKYIWNNPNQ